MVIFAFDQPVLVDTNVLMRAPDLINRWSAHIRLIILPEVVDEIDKLQSRGRLSHAFLETLLAARNSHLVETPPWPTIEGRFAVGLERVDGLGNIGCLTLNFKKRLQMGGLRHGKMHSTGKWPSHSERGSGLPRM